MPSDHGQSPPERNLYLDALRAGALLVVVLGQWMERPTLYTGARSWFQTH